MNPSLLQVDTPETVITLAISGDQLAVGTAETEVIILNRHTGNVIHSLSGHPGGTNSLVYAAGTRLISAGEDGRAAIWDIEKGLQLESLEVEGLDADV